MCDLFKTPVNSALTLAFSHKEREPELPESPSPWGEGLG
jgi:hypothetical protein